MSECVLVVLSYATGAKSPHDGQYLEWVNMEADYPKEDIASFTDDVHRAKKYPSALEAMTDWKLERRRDGPRADGKPNRPLTAFTVEVRQYWSES